MVSTTGIVDSIERVKRCDSEECPTQHYRRKHTKQLRCSLNYHKWKTSVNRLHWGCVTTFIYKSRVVIIIPDFRSYSSQALSRSTSQCMHTHCGVYLELTTKTTHTLKLPTSIHNAKTHWSQATQHQRFQYTIWCSSNAQTQSDHGVGDYISIFLLS